MQSNLEVMNIRKRKTEERNEVKKEKKEID